MYASETWPLTTIDIDILNAFVRKPLSRIIVKEKGKEEGITMNYRGHIILVIFNKNKNYFFVYQLQKKIKIKRVFLKKKKYS